MTNGRPKAATCTVCPCERDVAAQIDGRTDNIDPGNFRKSVTALKHKAALMARLVGEACRLVRQNCSQSSASLEAAAKASLPGLGSAATTGATFAL